MIKIRSVPDQPAMTVYPAIGYPVDRDTWRVSVSGFAWYAPEEFNRRQKMMIGMLRNVMGVTSEELQTPTFESRINQFMAAACAKLPLEIRIGKSRFPIRKATRRNGSFEDVFHVRSKDLGLVGNQQESQQSLRETTFELASPEFDQPLATGKVFLFPANGISVVSDIDDTIKDTQVGDRRELLANTFLREFRSIEGMAELYQSWAKQGAAFHYVSSSPWQLFDALYQFGETSGFPSGTMHLRNFRLRDHLLRKIVLRRNGKVLAIRKLLQALPDRKFILIGDSGEKDPKIYRKICRQFPSQVKAVFIRDLEHRPIEAERLAKLNKTIPDGLCARFESAETLRELASPLFA